MGYRSDVVIAVDEKVYNALQLLNDIPTEIARSISFRAEGAVYWFFNDVKWYDQYPEVTEWYAFLNKLEEDEDGLFAELLKQDQREGAYGLLRLGEDLDDVETLGSPDLFNIYREQSISFPQPDAPAEETTSCDT